MRRLCPMPRMIAPPPVPPPPPPPQFILNISQNLYAPNLRSLAVAAGWNSSDQLIVNISSQLIGVLDTGSTAFAKGLLINISGATLIGGPPAGTAFFARVPVTVNNMGSIAAGGGRGNNGDSVTSFRVGNTSGGGASGGSGGDGQGMYNAGNGLAAVRSAYPGAGGTQSSIVDSTTGLSGWAKGGAGGRGGDWGQFGDPGGNYSNSSRVTILNVYSPQNNRDPGKAVEGNGNVTWSALGTIVGARV